MDTFMKQVREVEEQRNEMLEALIEEASQQEKVFGRDATGRIGAWRWRVVFTAGPMGGHVRLRRLDLQRGPQPATYAVRPRGLAPYAE